MAAIRSVHAADDWLHLMDDATTTRLRLLPGYAFIFRNCVDFFIQFRIIGMVEEQPFSPLPAWNGDHGWIVMSEIRLYSRTEPSCMNEGLVHHVHVESCIDHRCVGQAELQLIDQ